MARLAPIVGPESRPKIGAAYDQRWCCDKRLVLAQIATNTKSNESAAVLKLLEFLSLKGTIVTTDALNCQREIARQIVESGGDYVLALKANHARCMPMSANCSTIRGTRTAAKHATVDCDHGRSETRISWFYRNRRVAKRHRGRVWLPWAR